MPILRFEKDDVLRQALKEGRESKAGLAGLLIAYSAGSEGCESALTFDRKAARIPFFRLLK